MATKEQKTERRWRVIKYILLYNAFWGIAVFSSFLFDYDVTKLDVISGALFGSSVIGLIGNWMSTPTPDDKG
jgi:hypothetical protein